MTGARLEASRAQILAFRRTTSHLDERMPPGAESLRRAGWAGLQDSMPRAALLSIHARVAGATPSSWEDPALVQLWGPRYSTYVVPAADFPIFSLGRLPEDARGRDVAEKAAAKLAATIGKGRTADRQAAESIDVNPNWFRHGASTGTIQLRWEGARAPVLWIVPRPSMPPDEATKELARRYLHVFGPTTAASFADWAGISGRRGAWAFDQLAGELVPVGTPIGDSWLLASDEATLRAVPRPAAPARLLPSGDTFYLLQGRDRELVLTDAAERAALWTSRVWPGAVLVGGEVVGTWRRAGPDVSIEPFRRLSVAERQAVEEEASGLPLPGLTRAIRTRWPA